ncbi:MAG: hypothetical protein KUG56_01305 [Kordiimonadaceae bacterium]|nr:hypothetical protein [Kordiimonadaceae bacterium]
MSTKLRKFYVHPGETESRLGWFEAQPVAALEKFTECFNSDGQQVYEIPTYIAEFINKQLHRFLDQDVSSLDAAFGGRTARQRNHLTQIDFESAVNFEWFALKDQPQSIEEQGLPGSPSEQLNAIVAEKFGISEDYVKKITRNTPSNSK